MPCKEFTYVYKPKAKRRKVAKGIYRWCSLPLPMVVYERLGQIAKWEGRTPNRVALAMFHLGMETYQTLLDGLTGTCLPEGLPGLPGMETLIEAVGKAQIQRETIKRISMQSAEIVEEQRRERERDIS